MIMIMIMIVIIVMIMIMIIVMIIITIHIIIMEIIFMNTENSETNESHRFKLDLADKLKNPKKNMALVNLSIYYTWKNIMSEYKNNKFKISAPAWNETFDLPEGSYSI